MAFALRSRRHPETSSTCRQLSHRPAPWSLPKRSKGLNMKKHLIEHRRQGFVLDSAKLDVQTADGVLQLAMCMEAGTHRVLTTGLGTDRDGAMVAAFRKAVEQDGVPIVVEIDNAASLPQLVRECWLQGVEIISLAPFNPYSGSIERQMRRFREQARAVYGIAPQDIDGGRA
ncbi:hypothetical protein KL86APRO_12558 [uncultured Alphaproteobacteria bacterium]|uniref:Integrase catalytic domain-containing protein n=1 Tax=uncultured Alphaproteobacteria bacterium TaxID=91750 RepID=A0A212KC38_9PROT|nr:hypothetical protein KL86APRO_12558 [uncultured Alphaproteobacteria bacterium]